MGEGVQKNPQLLIFLHARFLMTKKRMVIYTLNEKWFVGFEIWFYDA